MFYALMFIYKMTNKWIFWDEMIFIDLTKYYL
jgi:hypothetical protein